MITAIVLPADMAQPIRQQQVEPSDLKTYWELVDGHLEVVDLFRPSASLYINEEGKLNDLPLNQRATVITWVHNSDFCGQHLILGDAFIVGPIDDNGDDLTVPEELVKLLFETPSYRVAVKTTGSSQWNGDQLRWDNWLEAYMYAIDLAQRWKQIQEVRVVAAT
ncbi:MAG: DUF3846 domain-containing protein [Acidobacteria bacterium]|nr:DUF3846 domain-containing protein [Acidobacteriota bacterium]